MCEKPNPLFLLSLPRSGSTLLQRLVAAHREVATCPESWVLLPYLLTFEGWTNLLPCRSGHLEWGLEGFCKSLPDGRSSFNEHLRHFARDMYADIASDGAAYFEDKSPAYALVCNQLPQIFPQARFLLLWRHPFSQISSGIRLWGRGRWRIYDSWYFLHQGVLNLLQLQREHPDRVLPVHYEQLVGQPEQTMRRVTEFLEIDFDPTVLTRFTDISFKGQLADPTGSEQYQTVSSEPLARWKQYFADPLSKRWARRYIDWLGEENLREMGYPREQLLAELKEPPLKLRCFARNAVGMALDVVRVAVRRRAILSELGNRADNHRHEMLCPRFY